jgi:hypothetical protein
MRRPLEACAVHVCVCALVSRTRAHLVSEFLPRLVSAAHPAARLGALGPLWAMWDPLSADPVIRTEVHVSDMVMSG